MPLRIWRSDAVQPLTPHRNDPAPGGWTPDGPEAVLLDAVAEGAVSRAQAAAASRTGTGWRIAALSRFQTLIAAIETSSAASCFSS